MQNAVYGCELFSLTSTDFCQDFVGGTGAASYLLSSHGVHVNFRGAHPLIVIRT